MIPTIGIMIGAYAIARLISLVTRGGERRESVVAIVFAVLAMLVILFCMADLLLGGNQTRTAPFDRY